jgi:hypothetical protein
VLGECFAGEVRQQKVARRHAHVHDAAALHGHQEDRKNRPRNQVGGGTNE